MTTEFMTTELFMTLLLTCSVFTGLVTEALKKQFESPNNILAGVIAIAVSTMLYCLRCMRTQVTITPQVVTTGIALCLLSWLCAMLGFDKIKQAIKQCKGD